MNRGLTSDPDHALDDFGLLLAVLFVVVLVIVGGATWVVRAWCF